MIFGHAAECFQIKNDDAMAADCEDFLLHQFLQAARDHFSHRAEPGCQLRVRQWQRKGHAILQFWSLAFGFFQQQRRQALSHIFQR